MLCVCPRTVCVCVCSFPLTSGAYLGGADQLDALLRADGFLLAVTGARSRTDASAAILVPWHPLYAAAQASVRLLEAPRAKPWYLPHLYIYGSIVRGISLIHVLFFVAIYVLASSTAAANQLAATVLLWFLLIDTFLLTLFGPTPWSLVGLLTTCVFWRIRGNSSSSLPYKVVWAYYVIVIIQVLASHAGGRLTEPNGVETALYVSSAINSAALAVFRF
jgi:hypothetical protein